MASTYFYNGKSRTLRDAEQEIIRNLQQKFYFVGEAAKECAEDLLKQSQELVPVRVQKRGYEFKSEEEAKTRMKFWHYGKGVKRIGKTVYGVKLSAQMGGRLKESGRVVEGRKTRDGEYRFYVIYDVTTRGNKEEAQMPVTDPDLPQYKGVPYNYAVIQHEAMEFHHVIGEAKYVEKPYRASREGYLRKLANTIKTKVLK
jgi:hypothetical protein